MAEDAKAPDAGKNNGNNPTDGGGSPSPALKPSAAEAGIVGKTEVKAPPSPKLEMKPSATKGKVLKPAASVGPAFHVQSLMTKQIWRKIFIYGIPGSGKTLFAGTAADCDLWGDVFFVGIEKGELTLQETDRIVHKERLSVVHVNDLAQIEKTKNWLVAHAYARDRNDEVALLELEAKAGMPVREGMPARRFRTAVIDTVSEIQAFSGYLAKGYNDGMAIDGELTKTNWDHFNDILDRMQIAMRAYRDLQMHTIFLCQATYGQDETKKRIFGPALQGQMQRQVQGFVDVVGYLKAEEPKTDGDGEVVQPRKLWVQPVGPFAAKCRAAAFTGTHIVDPTVATMCKAFGWAA